MLNPMSTSVVELFPTGSRADDTIRRTIQALIKGKQISPDEVAAAAGMSRSAFFRKMGGHGSSAAFKAGEVADIAHALGVSVGQLYDGLGGTFTPPDDNGGGGGVRHPGLEPGTHWFGSSYPCFRTHVLKSMPAPEAA